MIQVRAATPPKVLFLGDSLTAGYGVEQSEAYPQMVANLLKAKGHAITVINGSVSGSFSATATSRLRWQLKAKPDVLVLALGENDALQGTPTEVIKTNLAKCIELAQQNHVRILLVGFEVFPNYGKAYTESYRRLYPSLAQKYHIKLLPFLLEGVGGVAALNQADGKHPNAQGHHKIAETVVTYLEGLL